MYIGHSCMGILLPVYGPLPKGMWYWHHPVLCGGPASFTLQGYLQAMSGIQLDMEFHIYFNLFNWMSAHIPVLHTSYHMEAVSISTLFLEQYKYNPKHIDWQVFALQNPKLMKANYP